MGPLGNSPSYQIIDMDITRERHWSQKIASSIQGTYKSSRCPGCHTHAHTPAPAPAHIYCELEKPIHKSGSTRYTLQFPFIVAPTSLQKDTNRAKPSTSPTKPWNQEEPGSIPLMHTYIRALPHTNLVSCMSGSERYNRCLRHRLERYAYCHIMWPTNSP